MRYFLLFIIVFTTAACGTAPVEDTIIGKWNYDHLDFKATANNQAISNYDRDWIAKTATEIKHMELEFFKDKTFDLLISKEYGDFSENGRYAIEGDGKYISKTSKSKYGSEERERWEIVRLSDDSLTVITAKGAYVVYARMK